MNRTDKGDAFVADMVALAQKRQIEPGHAIECFGKVAGMLTKFEMMKGRVRSLEAGVAFVAETFMVGVGHALPIDGSISVRRVEPPKTH